MTMPCSHLKCFIFCNQTMDYPAFLLLLLFMRWKVFLSFRFLQGKEIKWDFQCPSQGNCCDTKQPLGFLLLCKQILCLRYPARDMHHHFKWLGWGKNHHIIPFNISGPVSTPILSLHFLTLNYQITAPCIEDRKM